VAITVVIWFAACASPWHSTREAGSSESLFSYRWVWTDEQGQRVALSRWRGTPVVMTAIYTSCDNTCPRTIARLRKVYDEYQHDGRQAEFVVVTLDPVADTPEQLRHYKEERRLPAAWHLLRGDVAQTAQLGNILGVRPMEMDAHYVHESRITVFDGNGASRAVLDVF